MTSWLNRAARRLKKARSLLQPAVEGRGGVWADLGCGDGIFTYLLADLLRPGSQIYAVDQSLESLQALQRNLAGSGVTLPVHLIQADFTRPLSLPPLDGLVMANSIHFVRHKKALLKQLAGLLKPAGRLVIVEYNTGQGNYAVPHPLADMSFLALAAEAGLQKAYIAARAPSSFLGEMYTGVAFTGGPSG